MDVLSVSFKLFPSFLVSTRVRCFDFYITTFWIAICWGIPSVGIFRSFFLDWSDSPRIFFSLFTAEFWKLGGWIGVGDLEIHHSVCVRCLNPPLFSIGQDSPSLEILCFFHWETLQSSVMWRYGAEILLRPKQPSPIALYSGLHLPSPQLCLHRCCWFWAF